jgi:hypothetical protein
MAKWKNRTATVQESDDTLKKYRLNFGSNTKELDGSSFSELTGSPADNPALNGALGAKANLPDELVSGGDATVVADDITIAPASWRVSGAIYEKAISSTFNNISNSALGKQRVVAFFGNTSNAIIKVEGSEGNIAEFPNKPSSAALIKYFIVGDAGIGGEQSDLTGYALKADLGIKEDLLTQSKTTIVAAVNEVEQSVNSLESDQTTLKIFKVSNYGTI